MSSSILNLLAQASGGSSTLVGFLPLIAIGFIFYFLLILPQQRQRRKVQDMLASLKTGDRVLTSGGVYGTIVDFKGADVVLLQVASQVKLEVARSAITGLQSAGGEASSEAKDTARAEAAGRGKR